LPIFCVSKPTALLHMNGIIQIVYLCKIPCEFCLKGLHKSIVLIFSGVLPICFPLLPAACLAVYPITDLAGEGIWITFCPKFQRDSLNALPLSDTSGRLSIGCLKYRTRAGHSRN